MKTNRAQSSFHRFLLFSTLVAMMVSSIGCMTTYDVDGRPVQSVDPMVAVAGAAAAGLAGYAIANSRNDRYCYPSYYAPRYSYGGYSYGRYGGYCR